MSDILEFYLPSPAMLSYVDNRPLCNKGASAPPPPPPPIAPIRADLEDGTASAANAAKRRRGIKSTILETPKVNNTLGSNMIAGGTTTLGAVTPTQTQSNKQTLATLAK